MVRWVALTIAALLKPKALLVAENLCLRQQLLVLQRRHPRPRLAHADRRFWIIACRWFSDWRKSLLVVKPETVLGWHRRGWRFYWHWRSQRKQKAGRQRIPLELRALIRRMASANPLWGQRRLQTELARLGFRVSVRTVAKYMRRPYDGRPSPGWRKFLKRHAADIWACDFFCVQAIFFWTFYVFFVIHHASREVLHVQATHHPTAAWAAQQIVEACAWAREPPHYLIHDRDSRYGAAFDRRLQRLGIRQIRTPCRAPRANAIAERWVRSARTECLDHMFIFNESQLRRVLGEYMIYFNHWRPHRSIGQRTPCQPRQTVSGHKGRKIIARPVLGGLYHVYELAA
ncbi:MAG TPA: integrase core domain-containing protein [Candidatus Tectomicrobia bacterium]